MRPFKILRHAFTMVRLTLKSYAMLSVTIVLSFSLLLGYLVYSDSSLYNKYKNVFDKDRNVLLVYDSKMEDEKIEMLLKQVEEMENTYYYVSYETTACIWNDMKYTLETGEQVLNKFANIQVIPNRVWSLYEIEMENKEVQYFNGTQPEGVVLKKGEALMDKVTFQMLGLDKMEEPIYNLSLRKSNHLGLDEIIVTIPLKIVGTISSEMRDDIIEINDSNQASIQQDIQLVLSTDDLSILDLPELDWQRRIWFYSETPELIDQAADRISYTHSVQTSENTSLLVTDLSAMGVYESQNEAYEKMQTEARTKAVIAAALLLLLGINLYSSFTNALNDRKFEIGVKRAVGATSWDIVRQFLYESILVMMADIVMAVSLVTDIFIVYKFIYESIPNEYGYFSDWIIYVSPFSIAMFAVCSITLTVVFSLIFAYKSTQVEIVQYLKAE